MNLKTLLVALAMIPFAVACGETDSAGPDTDGATGAGGKGDSSVNGGNTVAGNGMFDITDDVAILDHSVYDEAGYDLYVYDELAQSLRNLFLEAQAATGTDLETLYAEEGLISCHSSDATCYVEKIDEITVGEPGADAVLTMSSSWDGGLYYLHKMMVAADYGDFDFASYGRFSCTTADETTRCSIAAPAAVTELAEGIELREPLNESGSLVLRGEAAQSLNDLFDLAQSYHTVDIDLRDAYINDIYCENDVCYLRGPYEVSFDQQQGPAAATIRSVAGSEGHGLYYMLKLMVIAELGDFDGASHGAFTCRYVDDVTVCDVAP